MPLANGLTAPVAVEFSGDVDSVLMLAIGGRKRVSVLRFVLPFLFLPTVVVVAMLAHY